MTFNFRDQPAGRCLQTGLLGALAHARGNDKASGVVEILKVHRKRLDVLASAKHLLARIRVFGLLASYAVFDEILFVSVCTVWSTIPSVLR